MRPQLGQTNSIIHKKHALLCPDSHEKTPMPNWPEADIVYLITPHMGANFTQYLATMPDKAHGHPPIAGAERFLLVLTGHISLQIGTESHTLTPEGYAFLPANVAHTIQAQTTSHLIIIERMFTPLVGQAPPQPVVAHIAHKPTTMMTDDGLLTVQKLLPQTPSFDCEINIMTFKPGGSLPYVETHFVEHGLLMLNGGGIYRLDDNWYGVTAGDAIWMGPFCAQWFGALGSEDARYLIYKNWHRDPLRN